MKYFQLGSTYIISLFVSALAFAQVDTFKDGPVIIGFGKHAPVQTATVNKDTKLKVAFDIGKPAEGGKINHKIDSLARFINMHVTSGVKAENIELALVVHGKASFDILDHATYQKLYSMDNPNKPLIQALLKNNVRIMLCGQTGNAYEIAQSQLIDGIEVELSAMTAHALLQQQGFTLNPF
jgi:intracellular sulfur oxidation DsrE/DsrF family protein